MVFPLVPVAAAGLGILGGIGVESLLGSSKKDVATSTVTHAPYETYSPTNTTTDSRQFQYLYSPQYAVQIESPGAAITKKDQLTAENQARIQPDVRATYDQPQNYATGTSQGTDLTKMAIIGVIGLVAYGLVSK